MSTAEEDIKQVLPLFHREAIDARWLYQANACEYLELIKYLVDRNA